MKTILNISYSRKSLKFALTIGLKSLSWFYYCLLHWTLFIEGRYLRGNKNNCYVFLTWINLPEGTGILSPLTMVISTSESLKSGNELKKHVTQENQEHVTKPTVLDSHKKFFNLTQYKKVNESTTGVWSLIKTIKLHVCPHMTKRADNLKTTHSTIVKDLSS